MRESTAARFAADSFGSAHAWWSVCALALAPFAAATVALPLRLHAQAGLLLGLIAIQLLWRRPTAGPLPLGLRVGLASYALATVWGSVVGLVSGNAPSAVLGQALSMGLLPLSAFVFFRRRSHGFASLAVGLGAAAAAALALQFALPWWLGEELGLGERLAARFRIAEGVSFTGISLLALMICLAALGAGPRPVRRIAGPGALAAVLLLLGGMSRGLWLCAGVSCCLLIWLRSSARLRARLVWSTGLVALAVAGFQGFALLSTEPLPGLELAEVEINGRGSVQLAEIDWSREGALEVRLEARGPIGERLNLWTVGRDADGTVLQRSNTLVLGSGDQWSHLRAVVPLPTAAERVQVAAFVTGGSWRLGEVESYLCSGRLAAWLRSSWSRPTTVLGGDGERRSTIGHALLRRSQRLIWSLREPTSDPTTMYRIAESRAVIDELARSSWPRRLIGAGLGASFPHRNRSFDSNGRPIMVERSNYVHNFYLFLSYKLGAVGLLVLLALALFVVDAWFLARRSGPNGWYGAGAISVWVGYSLWGLSSPEIVDFRCAPLLGSMIAAGAVATIGQGSRAGDSDDALRGRRERELSQQFPPRHDVVGTPISLTSYDEMLEILDRPLAERATLVSVCNVHSVMSARRDPALREALDGSDIATPDGMPLVWTLRMTADSSQSRVYGPELMKRALVHGVDRGWKHYFFGGSPAALARLEAAASELAPGISIVGSHSPPFRPLTAEEEESALEEIRASGATLLWVGLGMPKQELWIWKVREKLPGVTILGVGAAFDFIAGTKPQAPAWVQEMGLEWLFRLASEPRRLWRRYAWNNPAFFALMLSQVLRSRVSLRRVAAPRKPGGS